MGFRVEGQGLGILTYLWWPGVTTTVQLGVGSTWRFVGLCNYSLITLRIIVGAYITLVIGMRSKVTSPDVSSF